MPKAKTVILGGVRTPFVKARSVFQGIPASTLGGIALNATLQQTQVPAKEIEEVIMGIVSPPTEGSNVAREALFDASLPPEIPCVTVNRYCASALEAISMLAAKIEAEHIHCGLAGGTESISSVRAIFSEPATHYFQSFGSMKTAPAKLKHLAQFHPSYLIPHAPGIVEPTLGLTMGQSADLMARHFKISRSDQDAYAQQSHLKAAEGWSSGFFKSHVTPVTNLKSAVIMQDTDIRKDSTIEKLAKLKPVFYPDGTITAGNASPLTDGASAVCLAHAEWAKTHGIKAFGVIRSVQTTAINIQTEPLLIAPAYAIPMALKKAGVTWQDIDLIEMHEAFAGQALSTLYAIESNTFCQEKLHLSQAIGKVDRDRLNIYGGSIPLGHPFGATGGRLVLQALHGLHAKKKNLALITVCAAGGLGMAMIIEAVHDIL